VLFRSRGLVRLMSAESVSAGLRVKLTAGTLSVTGAPVDHVSWVLRDDGSNVLVHVAGERSFKVGGNYLIEALEWINLQFKAFLLGRSDAAQK
jgi:hypothetical protein